MAQITVEFERDDPNDLWIARPCCQLHTEDDVKAWYELYRVHYETLKRKVDVIFVLDMFALDPSIAAIWGTYLARLHEAHVRYSIRVASPSHATVVFGLGFAPPRQSVVHDIPSAIAAIKAMREAGERQPAT